MPTLAEELEDRILREHVMVCDFDPIDILDSNGLAKPLNELTREQRQMITNITVTKNHVWDGRIKVEVSQTFRYALRDRNAPMLKLARTVEKIIEDRSKKKEVTAPVTRNDRISEVADILASLGLTPEKIAALASQ